MEHDWYIIILTVRRIKININAIDYKNDIATITGIEMIVVCNASNQYWIKHMGIAYEKHNHGIESDMYPYL